MKKPSASGNRKPTENAMIADLGMAKRFAEFRKKYVHKKQLHAAPLLDVSQSTLSVLEKGARQIPFELIQKLEKDFQLNYKWLTSAQKPIQLEKVKKTNTLLSTFEMQDMIYSLTKQVEILTLNLNRSWTMLERQGVRLEQIEQELRQK